MDENYINDIKKQISESEIKLKNLDQAFEEISNKKQNLLKENEILNQNHKLNEEKISTKKIEINSLQEKIKANQQKISDLKSEIISQKKVIQGRVQEILDIAKENQVPVIFLNKNKDENSNNLNNLPENVINKFEDKGNINDNADVDEEKDIKNKLFNLIQNKEKVEQLYQELGKEQIYKLFDFNFKKMDNQKLKKNNGNKNKNMNMENNNNKINKINSNSNNIDNISNNNNININNSNNNNINNNEINRNNNSNNNEININNSKNNNNINNNINNNKINNKINNNIINNKNNSNNSFSSKFNEETKKKKIKYEQMSVELKGKCSQYHDDIEQGKYLIENYKNFLNELNRQLALKNERSNIKKEDDQITINIDEKENMEFIESQMKVISSGISKLSNIFQEFKNNFGANVEQFLTNIFSNLKNLNKKENKNDINKISIILNETGAKIEELQKICNLFEKNKKMFYIENDRIIKEVNKLQNKIFNNQNKENELFNIGNYNDNNDENILAQSFLIRYKNEVLKKNNYDNLNGDLMENYIDEPKLIRKNWIEKCYIYDDKDVHDVFYEIKAISDDNKLIFNSCSYGFDYDKNIKIKYLTVDDQPVSHIKKLNSIEFKIKLSNSQTSKIHIMYEESKDLSKLTEGEIEERKIYREGKYGLQSTLNGQKAKYTLIVKGNFEIVNFTEYFLIKNEENIKNTEYFWEGIVPYNGKITNIIFSKSEAKWSFSLESKLLVENPMKKIKLVKQFSFVGGNNEIEELKAYSPQTNEIFPDEENRRYIVQYENIDKEADFFIKGVLNNKSKGMWLLDITNEDLGKRVPIIDQIIKPQLSNLAKDIIEDFDRTNTNKDFEFLDYMKIGLWVHKNIKYDLNYTDKDELTPADVYYQRAGVSHHFTQLTNALLFALGYKVIYIMGFISQNNKEFSQDSSHSWSLIKLNNRWYPFDSTCGIFSGKLPISHIFSNYFYVAGSDCDKGMKLEKDKIKGIYLN